MLKLTFRRVLKIFLRTKKLEKSWFEFSIRSTTLWAFAIFPLVDTGNFWLIVLAITGGLVFVSMMYGPQAAFFTELFSTEVRYSGATLGYQFGAILGGAFAPTIAALLWNDYGIIWVSVYIAFASFLTLMSVLFLTETFQNDLN